MNIKKVFIYTSLLMVMLVKSASSQLYNYANPLINNFLPATYMASSQNWVTLQDSRGIIYVGNTECLLEYDGVQWNKIYLPNTTPVFSITQDKNNKIFIGSYGEMGYITTNKLGKTVYNSLTHLLPESEKNFQHIWKILCISDKVYFFSLTKIYCLYNNQITTTEFNFEAFLAFSIDEKIFLLKKDSGIYSYENDNFIALPHTQQFNLLHRRYQILKYDTDKLLIITNSDGCYVYDLKLFKENNVYNFNNPNPTKEQVLSRLNSDSYEYIKKHTLYSAIKISDSEYAIGTITGGIVIIDQNADIKRIITTEHGLNNNCIYSIFLDNANNLWAALQQGISKIDLSYPLNYFDEQHNNLSGFVVNFAKLKNNYYVATMTSFYKLIYSEDNTDIHNTKFLRLNTEPHEFWNSIQIDSNIIASSSKGVYLVKDDKLENINKTPTLFLYKSSYFKEIIFANEANALKIYRLNKFQNSYKMDLITVISEIKTVINNIVEDNKYSFWIETNYEGIYNLTIDSTDFTKYKLQSFNKDNGIPENKDNRLHLIDNQVILATSKGVFKILKQADTTIFKRYNLLDYKFSNDSTPIAQIFEFNDTLLLYSPTERIGFLYKNKQAIAVWNNLFSKRFPNAFKINFSEDNEILIYTSEGLFIYNKEIHKDYQQRFNTLIRRVALKNDSVIFEGNYYENYAFADSVICISSTNQPKELISRLKYEHNSIVFNFAALYFEESDKSKYSYILEGFDNEWSSYNKENKAVYTNLEEGHYTFKVKAMNVYGTESEVAEYKFVILPPWYRTILAYICFTILTIAGLILLIYLSIKYYTKRLAQRNIELERLVELRTYEIKQQKDEIEKQSKRLEDINHELEKLSIVASETDNAVLIANADGQVEWINDGFTRLYGFTLEEVLTNMGRNLFEISSSTNIKNIIQQCLLNKKSIIYESKTKTKNNLYLWAQTTITPIVNKTGDVIKLVAIDSDISKLKLAEQEILQKNEEIMSQKEELELQNTHIRFQNEQITSSIRYAKTIQNAILPLDSDISKYFENFIIYRPKDIVSGDFYLFINVQILTTEYFFCGAIDCTGHGVPGAFMSMIGNRLFNEIIKERAIISPKDIIAMLDNNIRKALNQEHTSNNDGMDLCLIRIEKLQNTEYEIVYTGAKRPIYFYSQLHDKIQILKADRRAVGGVKTKIERVSFTNQHINLIKNDILYLTTDGISDQNNASRKRFGSTMFISTIENNMTKSMTAQKLELETVLQKWQGNEEQRDDITVIAIKL